MVVMLLQKGDSIEEPYHMLEHEEVEDMVLELDVITLNPLIVDGKEFFFLHDSIESLSLREDEVLCILVKTASMGDEDKAS